MAGEDANRGHIGRRVMMILSVIIGLVLISQLLGWPRLGAPPEAPVSASKSIILTGDLSGSVVATDASGKTLVSLDAGKGVFLSTLARSISLERSKAGLATDTPVELRRHENGGYSILDPATGLLVDLASFGADNKRSIASLWSALAAKGH